MKDKPIIPDKKKIPHCIRCKQEDCVSENEDGTFHCNWCELDFKPDPDDVY